MRPEQIHDALNDLDDELIEETAELRNRKRPFAWKKWTALAACICLVLAGTFTVLSLTRPNKEEANEIPAENEGICEQASPECAPELQVRILSWQENCFTGEIIAAGATGLEIGTRVEICLMHAGDLPEKFPVGSLVCPLLLQPETGEMEGTEETPVFQAGDLQPCE